MKAKPMEPPRSSTQMETSFGVGRCRVPYLTDTKCLAAERDYVTPPFSARCWLGIPTQPPHSAFVRGEENCTSQTGFHGEIMSRATFATCCTPIYFLVGGTYYEWSVAMSATPDGGLFVSELAGWDLRR